MGTTLVERPKLVKLSKIAMRYLIYAKNNTRQQYPINNPYIAKPYWVCCFTLAAPINRGVVIRVALKHIHHLVLHIN